MKTLRTDPGAKRLMESLRNMGYDCSTAIADLVDNSITAEASEIYIDIIARQDARADMIPKQESHPAAIVIADNGKGMSRDELHEAMRFGTIQNYSIGDLGKYGLGLKTASLSQCRILTVSSKAKASSGVRPRRHIMRWDIDHVYETNDWDLLVPEEEELESWEKEALNHQVTNENGTVVLWSGLDGPLSLLSSPNIREREKALARVMEEVTNHLRMVFHRFMQGVPGRRKLTIYVCGVPIVPWDPFCRNEKTSELDLLRIPVVSAEPDGSQMEGTVIVSPYVLLREDEFSSRAAWTDASGPKNWNQQQGLYFYRNNRLLQAGGWSRLRTIDEHTKLLRVAVDFPSELDRTFAINITKMRANVPVEIRERIESSVSGWAKTARARYDTPPSVVENPRQSPRIETPVMASVSGSNGSPVPAMESEKYPAFTLAPELSEILSDNGVKWELRKFCGALLKVLEAIHDRRINPEQIPVNILKKIYQNDL